LHKKGGKSHEDAHSCYSNAVRKVLDVKVKAPAVEKDKDRASNADVQRSWHAGAVFTEELTDVRIGRPGSRGCIRITDADISEFLASQKVGGQAPARAPPPKQKKPFKHVVIPH
jgi:hypothetical protein